MNFKYSIRQATSAATRASQEDCLWLKIKLGGY